MLLATNFFLNFIFDKLLIITREEKNAENHD